MDTSVLDALHDIGYNGPLMNEETFAKAINEGPKSTDYTELVRQLTEELKSLCSLEESVNSTKGPDDASSFILELSSFLKEISCPYLSLTTGHLSSRLQNTKDRLLLLDYLISELMFARIHAITKPTESNLEVKIEESETAKDIKDILMAYNFNKPPPDVTPEMILLKIEAKLNEKIKTVPNYVGEPLYNQRITDKQWVELDALYKLLCDDYKMRRGMLITRLDCTIQSFEWSGKEGGKRERIHEIYRPLRSKLEEATSVKLSDILAARTSLLTLKKTSDSSVRLHTKSDVNTVIMGKVPDRGGRPSEQAAPPPEMPSWQKNRSQGGGNERGGGGRGRGFGGGSRVQGSWNSDQPGNSRDGGNARFGGDRGQGGDRGRGGGRGRGGDRGRGGNNRGYQDNRNFNENFNSQDYQGNGSYQDNRNRQYPDNNSYQGQNQNYQQNQGGYQNYGQNYQNSDNQNYNQNVPYQNYQGQGQGKGRYQNEHDDRTNSYDSQNFSRGRGRSSYHRGGRH